MSHLLFQDFISEGDNQPDFPSLEACPFCGQSANYDWFEEDPKAEKENVIFRAECQHADCPMQPSIDGDSPEEVAGKWNTRNPPKAS